jgi:hypothetical protein
MSQQRQEQDSRRIALKCSARVRRLRGGCGRATARESQQGQLAKSCSQLLLLLLFLVPKQARAHPRDGGESRCPPQRPRQVRVRSMPARRGSESMHARSLTLVRKWRRTLQKLSGETAWSNRRHRRPLLPLWPREREGVRVRVCAPYSHPTMPVRLVVAS